MPTINQLSAIDTPSGSDLLALYSQSNGDARKMSLSNLLAWIDANTPAVVSSSQPQFVTQYAAPSATGFTVQILDGSANVWLILTPTAGFAAGTIKLPAVSQCIDKQEVLVNCTQQVTTLTVDGNGATAVTGEPATLGADDFFRLRFDLATASWYRVG